MINGYINYDDALAQIKGAGLIPEEPLELARPGGRSVRCMVEDGGREKRGWYILHEFVSRQGERFLVGSYGVFRGDDAGTFKIELTKRCESCGCEMPLREKKCPRCSATAFRRRELSEDELKAIKARQAEDKKRAEAERKSEADRAAQWASAVWRASRPAEPSEHDYIARKRLSGTHGARIFPGIDGLNLIGAEKTDFEYLAGFSGALVVPMCDVSGAVGAVQFILSREKHAERIRRTGRDKDYWPKGLAKDGRYFMIGAPGAVILQAEGYATAASLHEATGHAVAVAFDAGNMPKVATVLRKQYRRAAMLMCADDDWLQKCAECDAWAPVSDELCPHCGKPHRKGNAGVSRAAEAAMQADGAWIAPVFAQARPADKKGPTDFNDLSGIEGAQAVRAQIEAKLYSMWGFAPAPAPSRNAGGLPQGEGDSPKKRPDAVSVMSLDDAVDRFIPLDDGTGDFVFDTWTNKIVRHKQMTALLAAGVRGDDIKRHGVWSSRGAAYISEVGFDPSGDDENVKLNTWQGWPMRPKEGSCERLLELIEYLCCNEVDEAGKPCGQAVSQWLLRWMAYPLQHPGAKLSSAVIMHGPQGTGKSTIFQALAKIYGDYATVLNQRGLEDKFNSDWADSKLFILAEEVVTRAEMWHIKNELKELVTGSKIRVNPKNLPAYTQKNQINLVFLSNENQPLPLENDDRRHLVVYTPPALSESLYDEVFRELDNGGVEAFYHYLLNLDLGDFHPKKRPPFTESKAKLIGLSKPSEERFIDEWMAGETPWPFCPCATTDLYAAYLRWSRDNGVRVPRESNAFLGRTARLPGWVSEPKNIYENRMFAGKPRKQRMLIPCMSKLDAVGRGRPAEKPLGQWLTEAFFDFKDALIGQ